MKTETTADRQIVLSRVFKAPRELVFETFISSEHLTNWWGPNGYTITTHEMNVKPGGIWRFMMYGPNNMEFPNRITYIEVVKNEKLVYDHDSDVDNDPKSFHVTVTFRSVGDKTEVTMTSMFSSVEALAEVKKFGAEELGKQTLGKLAAYLEKM